jgi:hypothetical protein
MIRWFAYIVLLLIFAPCLSSAKIKNGYHDPVSDKVAYHFVFIQKLTDTTKKRQQEEEEKKKIKEVSKAKRQSKPEKIDDTDSKNVKPKRERRPEGMERPPEIPRRNGN